MPPQFGNIILSHGMGSNEFDVGYTIDARAAHRRAILACLLPMFEKARNIKSTEVGKQLRKDRLL